jgi:hypothetical protein
MEKIREQVRLGFERRNEQNIVNIFYRYATFRLIDLESPYVFGRCPVVRPCTKAATWLVNKDTLRSALEDLHIFIKEEDISYVFFVMDMDDNKGLDIEEFNKAIRVSTFHSYSTAFISEQMPTPPQQHPSPVGSWVRGLNVGDVLLDALPRPKTEVRRHALRAVADLTDKDIELTVHGFAEGIQRLLQVCSSHLAPASPQRCVLFSSGQCFELNISFDTAREPWPSARRRGAQSGSPMAREYMRASLSIAIARAH